MNSLDDSGDLWLTVDDVARERGVDRSNAWRWLMTQAQQHPEVKLLERRGRRLFASAKNLASIAATNPEEELERLKSKVVDLEDETKRQDKRIDGLSRDLFEFRRNARDWFSKHGKANVARK